MDWVQGVAGVSAAQVSCLMFLSGLLVTLWLRGWERVHAAHA